MLTDKLKSAVISGISEAHLPLFDVFAQANSRHINYLLQEGIINNELIDSALEELVLKQAKRDYQHLQVIKHLDGSVEALHHCIPEYLAHAMGKPNFDAEFGSVDFEDAKSKEEFCRKYGQKEVIVKLRERLLNPPKSPSYGFGHNLISCADGGPCTA